MPSSGNPSKNKTYSSSIVPSGWNGIKVHLYL